MNKITEYAIKRPVTVFIGLLIALLLGVISFANLQTDLLPDINLPYAIIVTTYQGASPEEVERTVSRPLEQGMASVNNVKNITSVSAEHYSLLAIEFENGTDIDMAAIDMRDSVALITASWKSEIDEPRIIKINPNMMPIMSFTMSRQGMNDTEKVAWFQQSVVPAFEQINGVASVSVGGLPKQHVEVEFDPLKLAPLAAMGLNEQTLQSIIYAYNFSTLAGSIEIGGVTYFVRMGKALGTFDDIKELLITPTGTPAIGEVRLGDLLVENGIKIVNESQKSYYKVNGADAITLDIQKSSNVATTTVTGAVNKKLKDMKKDNPNIDYTVLSDQGIYINSSINGILSNLFIGALLAIFILFLFIRNLKVNLTIALAIPVSLLVAFIMIYFSGITLNIISMAGLALGVGMLVDNSIVVIENIYNLKSEGISNREAALKGTTQMIGAIMASTLTTVCVFLPILFINGIVVNMFYEMALTIVFSLLASLIVAIIVVPVMAVTIKDFKFRKNKPVKTEKTLFDKIKDQYGNLLRKSLKRSWLFPLIAVGLFILSLGGIFLMDVTLMPSSDEGQININLIVDEDELYEDVVIRLDSYVAALQDKTKSDMAPYIDQISARYSQESGFSMASLMGSGADSAEVSILLKSNRKRSTVYYAQEARDIADELGYKYSVSSSSGMMAQLGSDVVAFQIQGYDMTKLESYAKQVAKMMSEEEKLTEIEDGTSKGSKEVRIVAKEAAMSYGLTNVDIIQQVAGYLNPSFPTATIVVDGVEFEIHVKGVEKPAYPTLDEMKLIPISYANGAATVQLDLVADVYYDYGYVSITRYNQMRVIEVSSKIEAGANANSITSRLQKRIKNEIQFDEGYSLLDSSMAELLSDTMMDLIMMLVMAVVLVFLVMAAQFQSFKSPFIVMFTLPLAFTGAIVAMLMTGTALSAPSLIGMVVLVGVVVNSGIILVDRINQRKAEGLNTRDAIIDSCVTRLRPILMTSLTTILAMFTMAIGIGDNSEFYKPIGIAAIGGLTFATALTLFVVPCFYALFDRKGMRASNK